MRVGEVARLAGVSVRTLHHWEAVGLLVPSRDGAYRSYTGADLERLQRVLVYRELGLGLDQVRALLDDEVDPLETLREQHELLRARIDRLQQVAAAVARALEARSMGIELDPHEVLEVFGEDDPTQHAEETRARWGDTDAYAESHRRTSRYTKDDWLRVKAEGEQVEADLAAALVAGLPASSPQVRALAEQHRQHICRSFYDVGHEGHRMLADLYVTDERFTAHYDRRVPGLAQYVRDAIHANADAAAG